ncbi:MAG: DUF4440 domain-containing protein, partial [Piscirickettsiaceae bacterium]
MNKEDLRRYSGAWNDHDIDKIMSFMTQDCVFETGGGTEKLGTRFEGYEAVRERFIEVWTEIPDVQFVDGFHFVEGDTGCSEWTIVGTIKAGKKVELGGCDIFTFVGGKI